MNTSNLYIRGEGSNTYLEARDSAIINAGFANFVREYELLNGYRESDEHIPDEAKSLWSETEEEISPGSCSNQSSSLKSIKSEGQVEVYEAKSRRSKTEEISPEICSNQSSSLKSVSIKSEENVEVNESKSRRSEKEEEISSEVCSNRSSSLKSASMNSEEQVTDSISSSPATSATSSEAPPIGTFSIFLMECTKGAEEEAERLWENMRESDRELYAPNKDSVNSSSGDQPVNGGDPVTPASSDNIFGRGTSSRACAKNVRRRHCKPKCPKPRMCRKPRAARKCQKHRAPRRCPKHRATKRCPKPKPSRSKCQHPKDNI